MPYPEDVYSTLHDWSERGLLLMRELLPLMGTFSRHVAGTSFHTTAGELLSASARSSESTLLLVSYAQVWDAEMTVRSVLETTIKFCYLAQGADNVDDRLEEYAEALFEIGLLKDHRKISEFLSGLPDSESLRWKPLRDRLLTSEEIAETEGRYPKEERRRLEHKWGFTGLVAELRRARDPLYDKVAGLSHGYSAASHILHGDSIGVSIPLERDRRDPARRDAIMKAHGARLISDVFRAFELRLSAGYRYAGREPASSGASIRIKPFVEELKSAEEGWLVQEYSTDE